MGKSAHQGHKVWGCLGFQGLRIYIAGRAGVPERRKLRRLWVGAMKAELLGSGSRVSSKHEEIYAVEGLGFNCRAP